MSATNLLSAIREDASNNRLDVALHKLKRLLAGSPLLDEALQQSGRYAALKTQIEAGEVSKEESTATVNHIRSGILYLVSEMESLTEAREDIRQETKEAAIQINQYGKNFYKIDHIDQANFS